MLVAGPAQVRFAEPLGDRGQVPRDGVRRPVHVERRDERRHGAVHLERPGPRAVQGHVLEEVQPAGLVEGLVGLTLPEHQARSQRRTARVHPEARDALDLALPDRDHRGGIVSGQGRGPSAFGGNRVERAVGGSLG